MKKLILLIITLLLLVSCGNNNKDLSSAGVVNSNVSEVKADSIVSSDAKDCFERFEAGRIAYEEYYYNCRSDYLIDGGVFSVASCDFLDFQCLKDKDKNNIYLDSYVYCLEKEPYFISVRPSIIDCSVLLGD